jgi:hypothetical protein
MGIPPDRVANWRALVPVELLEASDRGEFNGSAIAMGCLYPNHYVDNLDIS